MGKLTDDILRWTLDVNGDPARKELTEVSNATNKLERANKSLETEMAKLEAHGKKGGEEWKKYEAQVKANSATIATNKTKMEQLRKEVGLTNLSSTELRKEMGNLKRQFDRMDPNTAQYKKLRAEWEAMNARSKELGSGMNKVNGIFGVFKQMAPWLGFGALALGAKQLWGNMTEVRKEFEKYEAILTNSLGSQRAARKELNMLSDFAAQTPYQLSELTGAFVKLTNYGLKPTREEMRQYGDLASSVGKGFDQLAEAVADAVTGEFERLKEFGIKSKKEGDKITFTFKEQKTVVENTSEAIKNYFTSLGDLPGVAGSMAAISKTMGGATSNMADSVDRLMNKWGSGGFASYYVSLVRNITGFIDKLVGKTPTLTEELRDVSSELDKEITVLRAGNFTADERATMIRKINTEYKDYLPNLLDEKASLTDIEKYHNLINQHMQARIIYASYEEEIKEILKQQTQALAGNFEIEKKRTELNLGMNPSMQDRNPDVLNKIFDQAEGINNSIVQNTDKKTAEVKEKYEFMAKSIGMTFADIQKTITSFNAKNAQSTVPGLPSGSPKTDPFAVDSEKALEYEGWMKAWVDADTKAFAEKKRSQEEWTAFLDKKVQEQIAIKTKELEFDKETAAAQEELKAVRIDAVGQIAGALSDMFEQGSAAQIAFLAIEKAAAIAQIIFQTSIANAKAVAMSPLTLGQPWVSINTISAGAGIAAIVAQTIGQVSKKGKQAGGFSSTDGPDDQPDGVYHKNEFIGSAPTVRNPSIRKVYQIIDLAQKQGKAATLNLPAVMASMGMVPNGMQTGGFASSSSAPPQPYTSSPAPRDPELTAALNNMSHAVGLLMKNGVQFPIVPFKKELDEISDLINQTGMGGFKE